MIILLSREGQMCNQLLSLAALYSLGLEKKEDIFCPVIDEKLKDYFSFENTYDCKEMKVKMYYSSLFYYISRGIRIFRKLFRTEKKVKSITNSSGHQIIFDWIYALDENVFVKHIEEIRSFFSINPKILTSCKKIFEDRQDIVYVGVHLRRGDYKEYKNGIWYYDDEQIIKWLVELRNSWKGKEKIKFILCSNEKINLFKYEEKELEVYMPGKSDIDELCILSLCDYVMGPPSTYSFWASMYGSKPRCILDEKEKIYKWNDFMYLEERVKNGERIR